MELAQHVACIPENLHWFSARILDYYVTGRISTGEFLRWFHMPNSDYIATAQCIVSHYVPAYTPGTDREDILGQFLG